MTEEQCEIYQNTLGQDTVKSLLALQANYSHKIAYDYLNKCKREGITPGNMIVIDSLHHVDEGDNE